MNEKVEISLANGLIVSLEGDGCVDGHVVVQDGEAGKTLTICAAAIRCALRLGGEIISADSMQLYRSMDIGTAKPDAHERALAAQINTAAASAWDAQAYVQRKMFLRFPPILTERTAFPYIRFTAASSISSNEAENTSAFSPSSEITLLFVASSSDSE